MRNFFKSSIILMFVTFLLPSLKKALNMNNDDFLNGLDSSTPGGGGSSINNNGGSIYIQVCE